MFEIEEHHYDTPSLRLRYHLNPWDEPIVGAPVATISGLAFCDEVQARKDFGAFRDWCRDNAVALVSCRLPQEQLPETGFLESQGFRYMELNYRPELSGLQSRDLGHADEVHVEEASTSDFAELADIAGSIFSASRFHADPRLDSRVANLRYRHWMENAFRNPAQQVVKCGRGGRLEAFFVVESSEPRRRHWSLVGLAPGLSGHGLGSMFWRAMLRWHREQGIDSVTTSISSHNIAVFNLYVKLGFRFPAPSITLHWWLEPPAAESR